MACGIWLSLWSAKEIKGIIAERFNEEQLALARNVSASIERELSLLVKEISMLAKEISAKPGSSELETKTIERSLSRIIQNGVQKIEIVAPEKGLRYIHVYSDDSFL